MSGAPIKWALALAIIGCSAACLVVARFHASIKWSEEHRRFVEQQNRLESLKAEKERLSRLVSQAASNSRPELLVGEVVKLRAEVARLHQAAKEADNLRARNEQLKTTTNTGSKSLQTEPIPEAAKIQAHWPKDQLAYAGYADPASGLQSVLWAMSRGDSAALAQSLTPETQLDFTREKWENHLSPEEEMAASTQRIADSLQPSKGFYLVGQTNSSNEAILDVYFEGEGKTRPFELKKIGGEWKFQSLGNGLWP